MVECVLANCKFDCGLWAVAVVVVVIVMVIAIVVIIIFIIITRLCSTIPECDNRVHGSAQLWNMISASR